MDKLHETLTSIENWCINNDIPIFYGLVDEKGATEVSWTKTSDTDWEKYLSILKKSETKIITINININNIDTEDEKILDYKRSLEDEEILEFESSLKNIKKTKGHLTSFKLTFIINNVCYDYGEFADWIDDYSIVEEVFLENDEVEEKGAAKIERLSDDEIEKIARKITSNERYLDAKNPVLRNEIGNVLLKQEYSGNRGVDIYRLERKIETIYAMEIRPKQEEEIKNKVLELKANNYKKVEIASMLGVSSGIVNKYYYATK